MKRRERGSPGPARWRPWRLHGADGRPAALARASASATRLPRRTRAGPWWRRGRRATRARSYALRARDELERLGAPGALAGRSRPGPSRLLVWAPDVVSREEIERVDQASGALDGPARWGVVVRGRGRGSWNNEGEDAVAALLGLLAVPAPVGARGPALLAASRLATERGHGDAARRFELARRELARSLTQRTPPELRATLASVPWATVDEDGDEASALAPAQLEKLAAIARALGARDRLRPLLLQVLDTLVLWSGVERGLLLLCAPDGRLVPRAARNLARRDLSGEQLELSRSLAQKAIETGEPVVATDAFSTLGDAHASVHALRLRSVLAGPLSARGETFGVVYLDDRVRAARSARASSRGCGSWRARRRWPSPTRDLMLAPAPCAGGARRARARRAPPGEGAGAGDGAPELSLARGRRRRLASLRRHRRRSGGRDAMLRLSTASPRRHPVLSRESVPARSWSLQAIRRERRARSARVRVGELRRRPERSWSRRCSVTCAAPSPEPPRRGPVSSTSPTGALFLDEDRGDALAMQAKLLRVLRDGEVRAVGGERTRRVDVRIIAATHRDLAAMVQAKTFREDLYYRLAVFPIAVPPLRDRADDVPVLVAHFLEKHAPGRPLEVTKAAMARLVAYAWPGNVRQLENEIRRAVLLADERIDVGDLSPDVARAGPSAARAAGLDLRARVDALEVELVREALERTRGNQTRAAEILGLSRFGLQKMMRRLNVRTGGQN